MIVRALLLLVCLSAAVRGQTIDDVIPDGMVMNEAGALHWKPFVAKRCMRCKGERIGKCVQCWGKGRSPEHHCGVCSNGRAACWECAATGQQADPMLVLKCSQCRGRQREVCSTCLGKKVVETKDGKERRCDGCKGAGAFACPLCAGTGRLSYGGLGKQDPRQANEELLQRHRKRLWDLHEQAMERDVGEIDEEVMLSRAADLVAQVRELVPIPEGQIDRLRATALSARASDEPLQFFADRVHAHREGMAFLLSYKRRMLTRCLWRLQHNGEAAREERPNQDVDDIEWHGLLGTQKEGTQHVYSLVGRSYSDWSPHDSTEKVVEDWIRAHEHAEVRTVYDNWRAFRSGRWSYAWVVDGDECLNVHLVEKGCVPAGTLVSAEELIDVTMREYVMIIDKARAAEARAKAARSGVWVELATDRAALIRQGKEWLADDNARDALHKFEQALAQGEDAELWLDIGACHEALRSWMLALEAYDKAVGDGSWLPALKRRAHCMSKAGTIEEAIDWLREQQKVEQPSYLIGSFLRECEEYERAVPHLEKAVESVCSKHGFEFDGEGWLTLDEATLAKTGDQFAELVPALDELAVVHEARKDYRNALKVATQSIAIGRQVHRSAGDRTAAELEAGNVGGRLIRARIYVLAKMWNEVEAEVGHAKALSGRARNEAHVAAIAAIEAQLKKARAKD